MKKRLPRTRQAKLSPQKIMTQHRNNMHSIMIEESQFDTCPSGAHSSFFLKQEGKGEQNRSCTYSGSRVQAPMPC